VTGVGEPSGSERPRVEWGGLPSQALVRAGAALLLAALAATLGAFLLGEYQFDGLLPLGAGVLFGAVIAEIVVEVGRRRTLPVAALAGVITAGGLLWAGWISAGEGLNPIAGGAKLAAAIGFVTAASRALDWRSLRRRARHAGTD